MALTMPEHHDHTVGVIALGVLTTVPLAACWLPVRRAAKQTPEPATTTLS